MFYVLLTRTLPGVRSTLFVFFSQGEADEFASCLHSRFPDASTETGIAGEASEVFEHWSF